MYLLAYETNDLLEFWPSLFDIFFTLWPAHSILWPIMPESQALTIEEQQSLFHAEEKYKLVSLFFITVVCTCSAELVLLDCSVLRPGSNPSG